MSLDAQGEPVATADEGAGAARPGCVTAFAVLSLLVGVAGMMMPFLYAFGPQAYMSSTQDLIALSSRSVAGAAVVVAIAAGLWRLQRWGLGLVVAQSVYGFGNTVYGTIYAEAGYAGSTALCAGLSVLLSLAVSLAVVHWFVKNRALFKPSPSLDRWIVGAGVLVLAVSFAMGIVWA